MKQYQIVASFIFIIAFSDNSYGQLRLQSLEPRYSDEQNLAYVLQDRGEGEQSYSREQAAPYENMLQGLFRTFRWWDIPFASATILPTVLQPGNDDARLHFPLVALDVEIAQQVARKDNGTSLGSTNPAWFPRGVLAVHFLSVGLLDILTNTPITAEHYERGFVFQKALIYTRTLTGAAKHWFLRNRPDGSDSDSFFSAHTSITFATSAFCYRAVSDYLDEVTIGREHEVLRDLLKGTAFAGLYGWASYVGYSRIRDNKHYLTDVVVGAAAGTIISNLLYTLHFDTEEKTDPPQRVSIEVSPVAGNAIGIVLRF